MPRTKTKPTDNYSTNQCTDEREPVRIRVEIGPNEWFSRQELTDLLKLAQTTLENAIREGELRVYKRAGRQWFLGQDVIDWLKAGERKRNVKAAAELPGNLHQP